MVGGRWTDVADRLQISPAEVLDHYRDLDSVADAWFLRGLKAMVAPKPADFPQQPEWRRIEICLLAWFDALAPHQRVTAQMLRGKMHLPHPHHWVPMIFNLSRVIYWLREAAHFACPLRHSAGQPRGDHADGGVCCDAVGLGH